MDCRYQCHASFRMDRFLGGNSVDEDLFYEKLQEKIASSTFKKASEDIILNTEGTY